MCLNFNLRKFYFYFISFNRNIYLRIAFCWGILYSVFVIKRGNLCVDKLSLMSKGKKYFWLFCDHRALNNEKKNKSRKCVRCPSDSVYVCGACPASSSKCYALVESLGSPEIRQQKLLTELVAQCYMQSRLWNH